MDRIVETKALLIEALNGVLQSIVGFAPRLLAFVALLLVGLVGAAIARWLVRTSLEKAQFGAFLERIGAEKVVSAVSKTGPSEIVARFVYWVVVVLFVQAAVDAIGLLVVSNLIRTAVAFIPSVLAAGAVVLVGLAAARLVSGIVTRASRSLGDDYATVLGRMTSVAILIVSGIMAIAQLKVEVVALRAIFLVVLAGAALGGALTFGLGSRQVTRNILAGFYARKLFHSGDEVQIAGQKGTLVSIAPTQTVIETRGSLKAVPNESFLQGVAEKKID